MKSWQARGEVQDSDDENLHVQPDVFADSDRPRKRIKYDHSRITGASDDDTSEDELAWTAPKLAAKLYGQNTSNAQNSIRSRETGNTNSIFLLSGERNDSQNDDQNGVDNSAKADQRPATPKAGRANPSPEHSQSTPLSVLSALDMMSSPLSEPENSPVAPIGFVLLSPSPQRDSAGLPRIHFERSNPTEASANADNPRLWMYDRRRNLRARQEKQLHPYMYDKAQYQKQCRETGIRPVRLEEQHSAKPETQDQAAPSSSCGSNVPSSRFSSQDDSFSGLEASHDSLTFDALPNLASVGPGLGYFDDAQPSSDSEERTHSLPRAARPGALPRLGRIEQRLDFAVDPASIMQAPLSPSETSDDPEDHGKSSGLRPERRISKRGFRLPPQRAVTSLPTPDVSSSAKPPSRVIVSSASTSPEPIGASRLATSTVDISSEESSSDEHTDVGVEIEMINLQRERKRIKGVLPASWLRIDLQSRKAEQQGVPMMNNDRTTRMPTPQKGVARRLMNKEARLHDDSVSITISDGNSSDSEIIERDEAPPRMQQTTLVMGGIDMQPRLSRAVDDEIIENDWIDPMLLSGTSRQRIRKKPFNRRPRISDMFAHSTHDQNSLSEERTAKGGARKHAAGRRLPTKTSGRSQVKPPLRARKNINLSIVDAPDPDDGIRALPQFVRLARRQARKQHDLGRQSPTGKSLRLATSSETAEALATLTAWRKGSIAARRLTPQQDLTRTPSIPARSRSRALARVPLSRVSYNAIRFPANYSHSSSAKEQDDVDLMHARLQAESPHSQGMATDLNTPCRREPPRLSTKLLPVSRSRVPLRPKQQNVRAAQLETLESAFDAAHRTAAFERRIRALTNHGASVIQPLASHSVSLTRFLQEASGSEVVPPAPNVEREVVPEKPTAHHKVRRRSRKFVAQRLDAEARRYRQPDAVLPEDSPDVGVTERSQIEPTAEHVLSGVLPAGARYSLDFDIFPLHVGTFFHESTFIGSGDFKAALEISDNGAGRGSGTVRMTIQNDTFLWGAWNEDVAAGFAKIPPTISSMFSAVQSFDNSADYANSVAHTSHRIDSLLRPVLLYLSKALHFLDPLDRVACVQEVQHLCSNLLEVAMETQVDLSTRKDPELRILQFAAVLAYQAHSICQDPVCGSALLQRCSQNLEKCIAFLASSAFKTSLEPVRDLYDEFRHTINREQGVKDQASMFSCIVVMNQIVRHTDNLATRFWSLMPPTLLPGLRPGPRMAELEKSWYDIFTVLPALEIDSAGVARVGSRLQRAEEDWSAIGKLIRNVLELYEGSCRIPGSSLNDYIRTILSRCSLLISRWGWRKSESVLGIIYDFFARRKFSLLHNEDSRGSPKFLERLHTQPSLEISTDDRSFHIFLKLIATSLLSMRKYHVYDDRRIGAIAWRFIPNHQRTFLKDADLQQSDLDSLRNHCDLLCTLYYASPPANRVSIEVLQGIVDHANSHLEACRLSVRTWANVTTFQASTSESIQVLDPLLEWLDAIISATIVQYHLARSEVEVAVNNAEGNVLMGNAYRESVIAKNQARLGSILIEALVGVQRALRSSSSVKVAECLIMRAPLPKILELFDPAQRRLLPVLSEVITTINAFLDVYKDTRQILMEETQSDDSQDFGDLGALHELIATESLLESDGLDAVDAIYRMTSQFVSNVIGADMASDDELLQKILDAWLRMGDARVPGHILRRPNYMSQYSNLGWNQMRETAQKRKFTPYITARFVEIAEHDQEAKWPIFTSWLVSLVQREATLKFQHVLTSSLLNCWSTEPLLQNLPFYKDAQDDKFKVTLAVLRERRLLLISAVLSNIRESFDDTVSENPRGFQEIRARYAAILGDVMQAMKTNYQDLQTSDRTAVAAVDVQGAYVEFVHHVVSFLQQYILDICPIDRFFTDSAAFPLPAADPTYVVGRLRSYIPKLNQARTRKQLVIFLHSVSERAAIEGHQVYLINQISSSMFGIPERGSKSTPSLRHIFLSSILPAYIENCLISESGWVFTMPILRACQGVLKDLYYHVRLEEPASMSAADEMLTSVLQSMTSQLNVILSQPDRLAKQHVLAVVSAMLDISISCLPLISFIEPVSSSANQNRIWDYFEAISAITNFMQMQMDGDVDEFDVPPVLTHPRVLCPWPDTKAYTEQQIIQANTDCFNQDGRYMIRKGTVLKEMHVETLDSASEHGKFRRTLDVFRTTLARAKREWRVHDAEAQNVFLHGLVV
jgi:hypothetical protein